MSPCRRERAACGLEDPRLPMMMAAPPRRADAPEGAAGFVTLQPEAGDVFLWESWLRHEVSARDHAASRGSA